jgi:mannonate dehydratase
MRQTWRWFGPRDHVSTDDMMQAGVEGIVSALHHIPTGMVWTPEEIGRRQDLIGHMKDRSASSLRWEVVESLPVSEDIKTQKGDWRQHIAAYNTSLKHLAEAGIEVICYNFMPVLDWTRTQLKWRLSNGATCMRFDFIDFASFDIFVLARPNALEDLPDWVVEQARERHMRMTDADKEALARNIVFGLPGAAESFTLAEVRAHLENYQGFTPERLRAHLVDFLCEVVPVAEKYGLRLCCHPDDPPFALLGLPRIMSTEADYAAIMKAVNSPANGITLCTGSLGARPDNDLPGMMERLGERVHFLHLRNVRRESVDIRGSFYEAEHLGGDTDMVAVIAAVLREERRRKATGRKDWSIPFRPDHGQDILDDLNRSGQPGYPMIGRLKGLAELRGIITALSHPAVNLVA